VFNERRLSKRCLAGTMSSMIWRTSLFLAFWALMACCAATVGAETCTTSSDMEPANRTALVTAGQRYFDFLAKGDTASMRQSAIPSLAADFSGIETTVKDNQSALAGSKAIGTRAIFLSRTSG